MCNLGEILELRPRAEKLAIDKRFLPQKQKQRQLRRQRRYRHIQHKKQFKEKKDGSI